VHKSGLPQIDIVGPCLNLLDCSLYITTDRRAWKSRCGTLLAVTRIDCRMTSKLGGCTAKSHAGQKSACGAWANYLVHLSPEKVEFFPAREFQMGG
jgi:hypothetical protein